jgi:protein SCO1/2
MRTTSIGGALTLACAIACQQQPVSPRTASTPLTPPAQPSAQAPIAAATIPSMSAESVYDLPISLVDRSGKTRMLDSFRGGAVLVTMFYGSCAAACPLLTADLRRIEKQLPESVRAKTRVLMVSFDQAHDTPEVLGRLTLERGMDPARWTLASANDDDARSLAGVLGIRYRKLDNGAFFHSSVIVLLDADGRPRARLDGLDKDVAPILSALVTPARESG